MNLSLLEKKLGVNFKNSALLQQSLIHRSYLNEHQNENFCSNERLEFLGDAVLELLVSRKIYQDFPNLPEGTLTAIRSRIVCTESLAQIAAELDLGRFLLLSRGEEDGGGRENPTLLANCLEAIIGAIYLDQGDKNIEKFFETYFTPKIPSFTDENLKDAKSLLQERTQETEKFTPYYKVLDQEGPDHAKTFTVGVFLGEKRLAQAKGRSKQEAEEAAARLALENFTQND